MKTEKGWIKLPRDLLDDDLWRERRTFSRAEAWIDLLLMCSHTRGKSKIGNRQIQISKGECIVTKRKLAARWSWDKETAWRFLAYLSKHCLIEMTPYGTYTIVKVLNEPLNCTDTQRVTEKREPREPLCEPLNCTDTQLVTEKREPLCEPHKQEYNKNIYISSSSARAREKTIQEEFAEMKANRSWLEAYCMNNHTAMPTLLSLIDDFRKSCEDRNITGYSGTDTIYRHFAAWHRKRKEHEHDKNDRRRTTADVISEAERWAIERTARFVKEADGG